MKRERTFFLLLLCVLGFAETNAQNLPQIYVHTDRSMYLPGDTVWFKAYIMAGGKMTSAVKNLYIDWADSAHQVLACNAHIAAEGYSLGQYVISETYDSPFLYLNAYTGNIHDKGYLGYVKSLHISAGFRRDRSVKPNERLMTIVPQNGQLVKGINNTIALRGEQSNGRPFAYTAEVLDSDYDVVTNTVSDSSGLADLRFIPGNGKYAIRWNDGKGTVRVEPLPEVRPEGIVMDITRKGGHVLAIRPTPDISGEYVLEARLNGELLFEHPLRLRGQTLNVVLPASLPSYGLLQLDLRNDAGESQAQCAEVVDWETRFVVPEIRVLESTKAPRGRQKIRIGLPQDVIEANLSISITDAFSLPDSTDTMMKAVLSAQTTCAVQPVYGNSEKLWAKTVPWDRDNQAVDTLPSLSDEPLFVKGKLLMSDKSWKRFGEAAEKRKRKGGANFVPVDAVSIGYRPVVQDTDTTRLPFLYTHAVPDANRNIELRDLQFFDTMEFRLSHIDRKVQFEDIEARYMFKPFPDHVFLTVPPCRIRNGTLYMHKAATNMEAVDMSFAGQIRNVRHIETVVVRRKVKPQAVRDMEDKFGVSKRFRNALKDYLPQQDPLVIKYSVSLSEYIKRHFGDDLRRYATIYLNEIAVTRRTEPRLVSDIDEFRWNEALGSDMSWIGLIKELAGPYGNELAIYQFAPEDVNRDIGRKIRFDKVMGYAPIAEVHNKVYTAGVEQSSEKDERQTLYWHPLIQFSSERDRTVGIEFYNNDFARSYWIVIKGVTADGRLVDCVKRVTF